MAEARKRKKRGRNTGAKGGMFEREICRVLTEWITGSRHPEIFWRSATSGAKATMDSRKGRATIMGGDIVPVDPRGTLFLSIFSVEIKNRKTYGALESLLIGIHGKMPMLTWWEQTKRDAEHNKGDRARRPLLIFKGLSTPTYCCVSVGWGHLPRRHITFIDDESRTVAICLLDDWLAENRMFFVQSLRPTRIEYRA